MIGSRPGPWFGSVVVITLGVLAPDSRVCRADDQPIEVKAAPGVDEAVFLVRALENTYAQWPKADAADPVVLRHWIRGTRLRLVRLQKHADGDQDPQIVTLYRDCLELLNEYERFLVAVGAIQRGTADAKDYADIGLDAVGRGFGVTQFALTNPLAAVAAPYAIAAGGVVSVGSGVYDLYNRYNAGKDLDERKKQALDEQAALVNNRFEAAHAGAVVVVQKLGAKHKWGDRCGFDGSIVKPADEQLKLRPGDPFAVAVAAQSSGDGTPGDLMRRADRCLEAARLVPDGKVYQPFRAEFVATACRLSLAACLQQLADKSTGTPAYSSGPVSHAARCVQFHRTYLALEPTDPGKVGHRELARALACAGRYADAVTTANAAFDENKFDAYFVYRYMRLMSLTRNYSKAIDLAKWLAASGWTDSGEFATDPDLAQMREGEPEEFEKLMKLKFNWDIDWGVVGRDSITMKNGGWFPIYDFTVTVTVTAADGSQKWEKTLTRASLAPGASTEWVLPNPGITYRGSDYKATASVTFSRKPK